MIDGTQPATRALRVHVLPDGPRFEGHFPGKPVLPAVAQLCDLILPRIELAWPDLPALTGAPRMKFSRVIAPGDHLTLTLRRDDARTVRFELRHADGPCATGTLVFG
jgi:3-hydroxyacyl-[acyl-carrier-protein] dehydratase